MYIWNVNYESNNIGEIDLVEGRPQRALTGHSHFISDITLSSESKFALTGSWDNTLRLWDIEAGRTTYRFMGHTKDVLSVTMSPDNRQIISSSRDRTIKLWNTLAECKHTFDTSQHSDWISSVRFTPSGKESVIVSAGWDRKINLWSQSEFTVKNSFEGHTDPINSVTISPDGSFIASGGKDNLVIIWNIKE